MLHINSPEHGNERANAKPLTMEEEKELVSILNSYLENFHIVYAEELLQRFIYNYENLNHFKSTHSK